MAEAGSVDVDGKRVVIHYHTGTVASTRKQKETKISSQAQYHGQYSEQVVMATSSTTVDHHELFIVDAQGQERAFQMIDMDIAVREGNTVTAIWIVPEDADAGPPIQVYNHTTGDRMVVKPERLLPWFIKKKHILIGTVVGFIVGAFIFWLLAVAALFAPYLYFKRRALNAIKGLLSSSQLRHLEAQLAQVRPMPPAAAA